MTTGVDFYELLDVPDDADDAAIKKAYRLVSRHTHPDTGGNAALFRLVQAAYATLSDPAARAAYDRLRAAGDATIGNQSPRPAAAPASGTAAPAGGGDRSSGGRPASPSTGVDFSRLTWPRHVNEDTPVRLVPHTRPHLRQVAAAALVASSLLGAGLVVALVRGEPGPGAVLASVVVAVVVVLNWTRWRLAGAAAAVGVVAVPVVVPVAPLLPNTAVGWGWLLTAVGSAAWCWWAHRFGGLDRDKRVPVDKLARYAEFGVPGLPCARQQDLGARASARVGAAAVHYLTLNPAVRVFHKVGLDASPAHAVDQVVTCGRKVVLVVNRCWLPGTYSWSGSGHLLRDGSHFAGGEVVDPVLARAWASRLGPQVELRIWVVVSSATGPVRFVHDHAPGHTYLGSPQDMVEQVGCWFSEYPTWEVDKRVAEVFFTSMY